jgi:hypothetical protein
MDATNWISSLAGVVTALGLILVWIQIRLLQKQIVADHERSRRELTTSILFEVNKSINQPTSAAEKIVKDFSEDQCRRLRDLQELKISAEKKELVEICMADILDDTEFEQQNGEIVLRGKQVRLLRFLVVDYLNSIEAALSAWMLSVADEDMMEKQFQALVRPDQGKDALEAFRRCMGGGDVYPSIERFVEVIRERYARGTSPKLGKVA